MLRGMVPHARTRLVSAVALLAFTAACRSQSRVERDNVGRWQMECTETSILLIDTGTARTWTLSHESGSPRWKLLAAPPVPPAEPPAG